MEAFAKGDAGFTVIEDYAADKTVAGCSLEFAQSTKVSRTHRRGRLDFHASNGAGGLLHHDIRFGAILVPKMEEFG